MTTIRRPSLALGFAALCLSAIAACAPTPNASDRETVELTLVSYAVTEGAYQNIIPKFAEYWQEKTGQTVIFDQSYGGSGSQTRAVIDGLEADVVALAIALDTQEIEKAGLIEPGWEQEVPTGDGIVHRSVAALVTREGGPTVSGWEDLAKGDVEIITANPKTSGGARWNYLVLWGALTASGRTDAETEKFVTDVFRHVPILPKNAREATDVFYQQRQGDVLINYENEVILAAQQGKLQPYIIPTDYNISIDNPVAVVDEYVDRKGTREVAEAFVEFLFTPIAQEQFAKVGFRPVDPDVATKYAAQFPEIDNLFTVEDLGGWNAIQAKFFDDGALFDKMLAKIGQGQ